jgi:hypothetical protein
VLVSITFYCNSENKGQGSKCQILHKRFLSVRLFQVGENSDHPVPNGVKCQEHIADACGVGNKRKSYLNARGGMNFKLSGENRPKKKTVMDYFDREAA